jgi:hypothetical protein
MPGHLPGARIHSATTAAAIAPRYATRGDWNSASSTSSTSCSRGAFSHERTARTPGSAMAADASIDRISPLAMVAWTIPA